MARAKWRFHLNYNQSMPQLSWVDWALLALAILVGGWLLFDGLRAFITGDYVTPASGAYAGQLGPWAGLLKRIGVDARSSLAKGLHVVTGAVWLISAAGLLLGQPWQRTSFALAGLFSLWYLPFGTLGGLLALVLSLLAR